MVLTPWPLAPSPFGRGGTMEGPRRASRNGLQGHGRRTCRTALHGPLSCRQSRGDHSEEACMADMIRKVSYYYTTTSDKPGEGSRLLEVLRTAGVNLTAVHAFPSARKTQVDFVPSDESALTAAAKAAKIKLSKPKTAFLIEGEDRVGALAGVLGKLGAAKINVTAISAVCAGMGRYGALFWVKPRDVTKAAATLGAM